MKKLHSHHSMIGLLAILVAILACGAPGVDIPFHISAAYRAKISGFQVEIDTEGIVPAGHDVASDGTAHVKLTSLVDPTKPDLTIGIDSSGSAVVLIDGKTEQSFDWFRNSREELGNILEQVGYQSISTDELDETVKAINNAMAGPKGVLLDGQTKWLEVGNIEIQR